jgi:divalent metal cation (Fe/Co/Zn/Cd) transporter
VTVGCLFLAVAAAVMALFQFTLRDVAKRRDSEIAQATAAHFRFTGFTYGTTAILGVIAAITSSTFAFTLALAGLLAATGSGMVFRSRRRSMIRRIRADRPLLD